MGDRDGGGDHGGNDDSGSNDRGTSDSNAGNGNAGNANAERGERFFDREFEFSRPERHEPSLLPEARDFFGGREHTREHSHDFDLGGRDMAERLQRDTDFAIADMLGRGARDGTLGERAVQDWARARFGAGAVVSGMQSQSRADAAGGFEFVDIAVQVGGEQHRIRSGHRSDGEAVREYTMVGSDGSFEHDVRQSSGISRDFPTATAAMELQGQARTSVASATSASIEGYGRGGAIPAPEQVSPRPERSIDPRPNPPSQASRSERAPEPRDDRRPVERADNERRGRPERDLAPGAPRWRNESLADRVARHEGRELSPYLDSLGIPTVGIGFNLQRSDARARLREFGLDVDAMIGEARRRGSPRHRGRTSDARGNRVALTQPEARALLDVTLQEARSTARGVIANLETHPTSVQEVVTEMAFQLGPNRLGRFQNTLQHIRDRQYEAAARAMLDSAWARQTPSRARELIELMRHSTPPPRRR